MKNVMFILPSFKRGGVERITLNIMNSLDYEIFKVHLVICSDRDNGLISFLNKEIKVTQLPYTSVRKAIPSIFKYLDRTNIDVVFTSFNHLSLPILFYKSLLFKKVKTVVRLNSLPSNKLVTNRRGRIYDMFFKFFIKKANVIVSQSNEMTKDVSSYYNISSKNICTIQNPVDILNIKKLSKQSSSVVFDENYYNLISIGSLSEVKGFDLLINAVAELKKKGITSFRLYIVGDNREPNIDYQSILEGLIVKLNVEDSVFLLGFHLNPYPLLKQSDAFVLSSRKEGFPNVVLEALVLDKPCLVTDCVDLSNILSENNSVVVEKDSSIALEEGLSSIVNKKGCKSDFRNFDFNSWFISICAENQQ